VIAMFVCPPAAARLMTDRLAVQVGWSVAFAVVSAVAGYVLAGYGPLWVGRADAVSAAGADALAGDQYGQLAAIISQFVAQVNGMLQQRLAQILPSVVNMQNQLLAMLNQMLGQVPSGAQPQLATAITTVAATGAAALAPMQQAIASGSLPVNIAGIVSGALNAATTALQGAIGNVQAFLPAMPGPAQGMVQQVLSMVTGIINSVIGQIGSFTGGTGGTPSTPTPGGLAGGITGMVSGVLGQVQNLLGGLFGNFLGFLPGNFGFGATTVVN
jgi:phage-related protein